MLEVKIDIVSDDDLSKRATMDTIIITKISAKDYMVLGDDRSNTCVIENLNDSVLEIIKKSIQSLIDSKKYCYVNIIPDGIDV